LPGGAFSSRSASALARVQQLADWPEAGTVPVKGKGALALGASGGADRGNAHCING